MTRRRPTFRERVAELAASHAFWERMYRERLAKYPPGSAAAEEAAADLARHLAPRPAMERNNDLFGMPPLMMLPDDLSPLDPLWEKAIKRGRAASLREMWQVLGWKYPPDPDVVH